MKMHYNSLLFKLPLLRNYEAIVLGRHCHTRYSMEEFPIYLLVHELIHQKQMDRHGVILFYIIYIKDYIKNLIKYRNHNAAYMNIPFEVEAYDKMYQGDL